MISKYSICNFKSIKNEQEISFIAKKTKSDRLVFENNILPVVAIYGPNGGGKSSILESLWFITTLIQLRNDNVELNIRFNLLNEFRNKTSNEKITKWKFEFISKTNFIYQYEIHISNKGIEYESLYKKENNNDRKKMKLVFKRNQNHIELNEEIKKTKVIITQIPGSLLSYLASIINIADIRDVYGEFNKIIVIKSNLLEPITIYNSDYSLLLKEKTIFLKIFKEIDLNIVDIEIIDYPGVGKGIIFTKNGSSERFKIPFDLESEGTKKVIQLLCNFVQFLRNGNFFCVDALDSQLHPKLLGYVIDLFNSENNNGAQLIFTSHDMYTLNKNYLRKDEIYFAALNELNNTDLVCLNDFGSEVREKTSISHKYFNGDFGYDPHIQKCKKWDTND